MVDIATGWTENASCRNNAFSNFSRAQAPVESRLPFRIRSYDSDNGSESVNRDLISWLHERNIEQTRSRPYRKNDQATVESRNNHVVRRHAFYYRYTIDELDLLNELWEPVARQGQPVRPAQEARRAREHTGRTPRRIHDIQDRLEDIAAPRTARLAKRSGPDMAYLNKTLARIAGVEPEDNETPTSRQGLGCRAHPK